VLTELAEPAARTERRSLISPVRGAALAVFGAILAATLVLWLLDLPERAEPQYLALALNTTLIGIPAFFLAGIAIRGFLSTGAWPVLWLGVGAPTFAVGTVLGGVLVAAGNTNEAVTVSNMVFFLSAIFFLTGTFFEINGIVPQPPDAHRRTTVLQTFFTAGALIACVTAIAFQDLLPPFFITGQGGTPLRQVVVAAAMALFAFSGAIAFARFAASRSRLLFWYALGLLLLALAMAGILMQTSLGTPLNWIGRSSQYVGGVYLLAAGMVAMKEARLRSVTSGEALSVLLAHTRSQLRDLSDKYATLFNSTPDGVWIQDLDGVIQEVNNAYCAMSGYSRAEIVGMPVDQLEAAESPPDIAANIQKVLARGGHDRFESRHRRKDGSVFDVDITALYLEREGGRMAIFVRDISERKQAERIKDEFIGMVSHELKTPLTVIMGAVSTALDERIGKQEVRSLLEDAVEHSEILASIVDNLLELSRQQSNRLMIQAKPADLGEIARSVITGLRSRSAAHRLVTDGLAGLPPALVDPLRARRVIYNLLDNAIKYSPEGGEVRLFARRDGDHLVVGVSDQGPGIAAEDQAKLFQSFERLAMPVKGAIQGTGLGLRVCRILVEAHGGRIWVQSAKGEGSTFYFTLPVAGEADRPRPSPAG